MSPLKDKPPVSLVLGSHYAGSPLVSKFESEMDTASKIAKGPTQIIAVPEFTGMHPEVSSRLITQIDAGESPARAYKQSLQLAFFFDWYGRLPESQSELDAYVRQVQSDEAISQLERGNKYIQQIFSALDRVRDAMQGRDQQSLSLIIEVLPTDLDTRAQVVIPRLLDDPTLSHLCLLLLTNKTAAVTELQQDLAQVADIQNERERLLLAQIENIDRYPTLQKKIVGVFGSSHSTLGHALLAKGYKVKLTFVTKMQGTYAFSPRIAAERFTKLGKELSEEQCIQVILGQVIYQTAHELLFQSQLVYAHHPYLQNITRRILKQIESGEVSYRKVAMGAVLKGWSIGRGGYLAKLIKQSPEYKQVSHRVGLFEASKP